MIHSPEGFSSADESARSDSYATTLHLFQRVVPSRSDGKRWKGKNFYCFTVDR
jgi:hypothetical protein